MFRDEVGVQDAVVAVALMEVSMQSSALVENVDALHTGFAKDPEREYRNQARIILGRLGLHDILERELSHSVEKSFPSSQKKNANSTSPVQQAGGRSQGERSRSSDDAAAITAPRKDCTQRAGSQVQTPGEQHRKSGNSGGHGEATKSNGNLARRKRPENSREDQLASVSAQHEVTITEGQDLEDFGSSDESPVQAASHRRHGVKKKGKHALEMETETSSETKKTPECDETAPAVNKSGVAPPTDVPHRRDITELLKTFIRKPRQHNSVQEGDLVLFGESLSRTERISAGGLPEKAKKSSASVSKSTKQGEPAKSTFGRQKKSPCWRKPLSGSELDPVEETSVQGKKKTAYTSGGAKQGGNLTKDHEKVVEQSRSHQDITDHTERFTGIAQEQIHSDANVPKEQRRESNPTATSLLTASDGAVRNCREKLKKFAASPRATETSFPSALSTMAPYDTAQTNGSTKGDTSQSEVSTNASVNGTAPFLNQKWPTTQELTTSHILGTIGDDELGLDDDDWMFDRVPTEKRRRTSDE